MSMKLVKTLLPYLVILIMGIVGTYYYLQFTNKIDIQNQNVMTLGDSLRVLKLENKTLYHKYVIIKNLKESEKTFDKEKILTLTKANIKLKDLLDKKEINPTQMDDKTFHLDYVDSNALRNLKIQVSNLMNLDTNYKPVFNVNETFNTIPVLHFINLDENNIYNSYVEIPTPFDKYVKLTELNTSFNETSLSGVSNVFKKYEKNKILLSIIPNISFLAQESLDLYVGSKFLFNDKYFLGINKSLNKPYYIFDCGLKFALF